MSKNYWNDFWKNHGSNFENLDEQTQVLRTYEKKPVSTEVWRYTLQGIHEQLEIESSDIILELCCGNGLISRYFSPLVKKVVAVDISEDLIEQIDKQMFKNIDTLVSDVRDLELAPQQFDKIIIYAGIQYLSLSETVLLFTKMYEWLTPGGIIFVGDIPDYNSKWNFYSKPEYMEFYFTNLKEGKDIIGTWFDIDFFLNLSNHLGFIYSEHLPQDSKLIYSTYRFDIKFKKRVHG